jgi:hypothetical protein
MPQFLIVNIVNESTEDTLESADNFQDARRLARQAAKQGPPGDPVSILGSGGIFFGGQFVLMPDGTIIEQPIASEAESIDVTRS